MDQPILTTAEAAKYLGISVATLSKWRTRPRQSLPFVRISARRIGYESSVLAEFIRARQYASTKEYHPTG
jgi:hypothetical protein